MTPDGGDRQLQAGFGGGWAELLDGVRIVLDPEVPDGTALFDGPDTIRLHPRQAQRMGLHPTEAEPGSGP